ncbi:putative MFS multidrug transporter [Myriangium duriaei CBS 260.36]|uniref:MFS multidrug transporter n=1 Tax=Myriangium duriaei CBS 260.36 TaxID=1168546 RepID=A0A9P4ITE0_9PEZI|nr:putative MFS multidrug transporter [Myriangium duriaei CBS 260.36]
MAYNPNVLQTFRPGELDDGSSDLSRPRKNSANATVDSEKGQNPGLFHDEDKWVTGTKLFIIMAGLVMVCFLLLLDISIVTTAVPTITSRFHSLVDVGWYGAAYQLATAALMPLTGKIYSNLNTKKCFLVFLLVFELGSLLCAIATSSKMFMVGRAVAGMGASGLQNGALTIIAGCAPMTKRPFLIGTLFGIGSLGLVCGPLIGGALTEYVSWRWCFYINLPIGVAVTIVLVLTHVPDNVTKPLAVSVLRDLHNILDLIGFAIFAPACVMLLMAVQFGGNRYAWHSPQVIGLFCGGGIMTILWLTWNFHKGDAALIPYSMLQRRVTWSSCLFYCFITSAMFTTTYYLPIYFQGVRGHRPTVAGVYLLPSILCQLASAPFAGKAVSHYGYYLPWAVAGGILGSIGYGCLSTLAPNTSAASWAGFQILIGFSRGFALQVPFVAVQNSLPMTQIPTAMSLIVFSSTIGGALFLSLADTIITNSLRSLLPRFVPIAEADSIIDAGIYNFRQVATSQTLPGVLEAFARSIDRVFYMATALALLSFLFAWGMGWYDIRRQRSAQSRG